MILKPVTVLFNLVFVIRFVIFNVREIGGKDIDKRVIGGYEQIGIQAQWTDCENLPVSPCLLFQPEACKEPLSALAGVLRQGFC